MLPFDPGTVSCGHTDALRVLSGSLPAGVSSEVTYAVRSSNGVFAESGLATLGAAQDRQQFLNMAERVATVLGSPEPLGAEQVISRRGCLLHADAHTGQFIALLREMVAEYGAMELRLLRVSTVTAEELRAAATPADFAKLFPHFRFSPDSVLGALIGRAACIDPVFSEEWPTVELADSATNRRDDPVVSSNLASWARIPTSREVLRPETIRALTMRSKNIPVYETI